MESSGEGRNWCRVIFSELSGQFHPRLARGVLEGFQQYSLQYVYDKEMWKDGGGEEHHPNESEDCLEHPASGMSSASRFGYKTRGQRAGSHLVCRS